MQEGGRPDGYESPSGVRGIVVALMRRNRRGAKDARKVDAISYAEGNKTIVSGHVS